MDSSDMSMVEVTCRTPPSVDSEDSMIVMSEGDVKK
jgi:hypothetical protein